MLPKMEDVTMNWIRLIVIMTTVNVVGMSICLTVLNVFAKIQQIQKSEVIFIINKTKKIFSHRDCTEKNGTSFKELAFLLKFYFSI